jgi:hypothetical protein
MEGGLRMGGKGGGERGERECERDLLAQQPHHMGA